MPDISNMTFGASFFLSILFSLIGMVYFMVGRKQQKVNLMLAGAALGIYPYFITNVFAIIVIGILLMAVPVFMQE